MNPNSVTVNDSPAQYNPSTGIVTWKRALGALTYNTRTDGGRWSEDRKTWWIDGKVIQFSSDPKDTCGIQTHG